LFATDDTIVAIATPPGRGALGIVRLSGPDAARVAAAIIDRQTPLEARHATLARVVMPDDAGAGPRGPRAIDQVVVTSFPAPHSYTGDDVAEISAHGSPVLLEQIVRCAVRAGARLARPGEFTLRAFLNDRVDLVQAEAVADLIEAVTPAQARQAFDQLEGTLSGMIGAIEGALFDLTARLEASVDFPDEVARDLADGLGNAEGVAVAVGEGLLLLGRIDDDAEELLELVGLGRFALEGLHHGLRHGLPGDEDVPDHARHAVLDDGEVRDHVADVEIEGGDALLGVARALVDVLEGEAVHVDEGGVETAALDDVEPGGDQVSLGRDEHRLHLLLAFFDDLAQDMESELDLVDVERDERLGLGRQGRLELDLGQPRELDVADDDGIAGKRGRDVLDLDPPLDEESAQSVDDGDLPLVQGGVGLGPEREVAPGLQLHGRPFLLEQDDLDGVSPDVHGHQVLGAEENLGDPMQGTQAVLHFVDVYRHLLFKPLKKRRRPAVFPGGSDSARFVRTFDL